MASNSEIVEKAAELIREHGWNKGEYGNKQDGYCLVGAGRRAQRLLGVPVDATNAAVAIFPGLDRDPLVLTKTEDVYYYNDHCCRNPQDALDALGRAAKHWRDKGE